MHLKNFYFYINILKGSFFFKILHFFSFFLFKGEQTYLPESKYKEHLCTQRRFKTVLKVAFSSVVRPQNVNKYTVCVSD